MGRDLVGDGGEVGKWTMARMDAYERSGWMSICCDGKNCGHIENGTECIRCHNMEFLESV